MDIDVQVASNIRKNLRHYKEEGDDKGILLLISLCNLIKDENLRNKTVQNLFSSKK